MPELVRLVCTVCGAPMDADVDNKGGKCKYCGSVYRFKEEKGPSLILAMNTAAGCFNRHDFDNAIVHYESILKEYPKDAEAAWGHAISTYGIVYAKDHKSGQMIPTCSRIIEESILDNKSYRLAISECAEEQRAKYEGHASYIDWLQKAIKDAMEDEERFDVFISFKDTDEKGVVTEDSVIARNIYDELTKHGIKTFFSSKTIDKKIKEAPEPIIYFALYTCKIFLLVATKKEYVEAPWVENEWSRFSGRVKLEGMGNSAFAVFKNISPYSLPPFLQNQGVNLEKHPFDYAQLIADNLSNRLGLNSKEKEELEKTKAQLEMEKRARAVLEEKLIDKSKSIIAEMVIQHFEKNEKEKTRKETEKRRKAEAAKRVTEEKQKRKVEEISDLKKERMRESFDVAPDEVKANCSSTCTFEDVYVMPPISHIDAPSVMPPIYTGVYNTASSAYDRNRNLENSEFEIRNGRLVRYIGNSREVIIPDGVRSIEYQAFSSCYSLEKVVIPDSVKTIASFAFNWCTSLTSVAIGNGVQRIEDSTFNYCDNIKNVEIGSGLLSIGSVISSMRAFCDIKSLEKITVSDKNTKYKSIDGNLYTKDGKTLIQYAVGKRDRNFVIPLGVVEICDYAFKGSSNLLSIEIPDSVRKVGYSAFAYSRINTLYVSNPANMKSWTCLYALNMVSIVDKNTGRKLTRNWSGEWK